MTENATDDTTSQAPARPFLRVVRGNPSDEELAVLTALIAGAAAGGGSAQTSTEPRNEWGSAIDRLRPQWGAPTSFTNMRY
ncbi:MULTISPECIES: acyl-CoA carboxylase subunit epsilon [unclassified Gordonia (in: high G+C Gram-positive bacteria)]|uniref:acyl-CoA carboxylase subunit epsilon n=1 Tax=unclassified Gordonia (in: high G+C Gram-positive bacteria) TaxID=2657482 RepID=UPI001F0E66BB|nr:acyl-CoA carboxylase subunit epsilon [Gordonia sp. ABSL49_1]MCH5643637.1 acyl-CoA carboxylase subunit epsilon [Gordonia sp. ABSL49_1]